MKSLLCLPRVGTFFKFMAAALCISLLAACGQKGPLFMPAGEKAYQTNTIQTTSGAATVSLPVNTPPASNSDSK